jgi:hypothetical protein
MIDVVDKPSQANLDPKLAALLEQQARPQRGYIYCATCSHVVSHIDHRIEVGGSHDHRFTNPHGFRFHLGCYREALGCTVTGPSNAADTWFPGFHWRIAQCEECAMHLGWCFANAADQTFFGLITERIQTDP